MKLLAEETTKKLRGGFGVTCNNCSWHKTSLLKNVLIELGWAHETATGHSVHYWF